jgi:hypothetical protein
LHTNLVSREGKRNNILTRLLNSAHTEKLGLVEVESVCAKARTVFRRITTDDVGIDGFIELMEKGYATGIILGVQIKSGDSFITGTGTNFVFKADQEHYGYWARCSFPVIGVVYSPSQEKAVWLDLTGMATDERILHGSYSITVEYDEQTAFTPANLLSRIAPLVRGYTRQRRTLQQIQELLTPTERQSHLLVPGIEVGQDKSEAWLELGRILFDVHSSAEEVADAGYRLSWYVPNVSNELQKALSNGLAQADDSWLARVISAIHFLLENNAEVAAELIVEHLLIDVPDVINRIEQLINRRLIPVEETEAATQVLDVITGSNE